MQTQMRMKHSAFMLLQTGLRDASAWPFITLDFCSSIVLSKTSAPPLWKHSAEVSRFRCGSSRPASGLGSGWQDAPLPGRNPADGVQEKLQEKKYLQHGQRKHLCRERLSDEISPADSTRRKRPCGLRGRVQKRRCTNAFQ